MTDDRRLSAQIEDALREHADAKDVELRAERKMKRTFDALYLHQTGGVDERKAKARGHDGYIAAENEWLNAAHAANLAKAKLDALQTRFEEWRTHSATRRAEMKLV